jgi:LppP/LprE lipoprotein
VTAATKRVAFIGLLIALAGVVGMPQVAYAGAAASRAEAQDYAARTYIVDPYLGRRYFEVYGKRQVVTASDGSRFAAFRMILNDTGDGTGQAVELFRNRHFVGYASNRDTGKIFGLSGSVHTIRVKYAVYSGNDANCCPSSSKTVRYRWDGSRVVHSDSAPLIFGMRGDRLHRVRAE